MEGEMKLLLKQRLFSWFDSYDVYDENQNPVFNVRGKLDFGHKLEIYDMSDNHLATLKQEVFTFLPKFEIYIAGNLVGEIIKEFTLFKPSFTIDMNGWNVEGDFWEWDYQILNGNELVATIQKQLLNWTDTYVIDVVNKEHNLLALMVVLAIDAVKCDDND